MQMDVSQECRSIINLFVIKVIGKSANSIMVSEGPYWILLKHGRLKVGTEFYL